jgi:anti-sigma28 factor (negative regulator of flagellin synthesis)
MSDLSQQDNESTAIAENTDVNSDCSLGIKARGKIVISAMQKIHSLQPVRNKKIFKIRQQLAEGTYKIDERLNVALDHILEDLIG